MMSVENLDASLHFDDFLISSQRTSSENQHYYYYYYYLFCHHIADSFVVVVAAAVDIVHFEKMTEKVHSYRNADIPSWKLDRNCPSLLPLDGLVVLLLVVSALF